jgi:secreted trypsin-like serine protease
LENAMRALLLSLFVTVLLPATAAQAAPPVPPTAEPEVVGGEDADPGEDPWMAALVIDERYEPNPFAGLICGASFISPDTVVTAAHCVEGFPVQFLDIVTGSTNLVPTETERIEVRNVRIHPDRDWRTGMYDVAAVQLEHPPTGPVTPIDLVTPGDAALWEPGDMARFTGWGVDELGQPISRLQEAESPIVSDTDCRARYTGTYFHGRTMVCAGDTSPGADLVSPCYGDSGGPLTVLDGARPVLVGLVLGGFRCGDPNYPAIFTQVGALTAFLEPYLDPDSTPDAVRNLNASRRGPRHRNVVVTWTAPFFDGGTQINHYVVTMQPGNRWVVVGPDVRRLRFTNVPVNEELEITVSARNRLGRGVPASVTLAPLALP